MNTIALQLRYRAPAPVRLKLAQANAVRLSCEWADAALLPAAFDLVAEIHASRTVAPGSTPLAAQLVANLTSASADPWVIDFSGAQLNHSIPNPPTRRLWMVVYLRTALAPVTVAAAEIELEYHAISGITPAPPAPAIYLTPEAAAELFASIDDVDALSDRVTALENDEGGGAALVQIDWAAVSGPASILNKPSLGNSSSRNVGTGAGDVAAGNHTHSSTNQIAGLDTALAGKADLSGGKLLASQLPDLAITQWLGSVANQSAMLALVGQRGDWCARTDDGKVYIVTAEPSSSIGNWTSLAYPTAPVLSVAGRTGSITLGIGDISGLQGVLDVKVNSDALLALAFRDTVGAGQIDDGAVGNGKLSVMPAATLKGSIAGGSPADLTATQVTALLNTFTTSLKGLAPASGGGTTNFLRADGTWAAPPGGSVDLSSPGTIGGTTPGAATFSSLTVRGQLTMRATGTGFASDITTFATGTGTPTNTESAYLGWRTLSSLPVAVIGTTAAGGGTAREIEIQPGGVTAVRVRTDGRVVVGGSQPSVGGTTPADLTVGVPAFGASASNVFVGGGLYISSPAGVFSGETKTAPGTAGGAFAGLYQYHTSALPGGTRLGGFFVGGSTSSTTYSNAALAGAVATENWSLTANGSAWAFLTTANGAAAPAGRTTKLWINHNGNIGIGDGNFAWDAQPSARLHVRGANTGTGLCLRLDDSGGIQRFGVQDNGGVVLGAPIILATFTVTTVPSASLWTRGLIYVSDDVGGPTPAFCDGTNWRRLADRAVVSTP